MSKECSAGHSTTERWGESRSGVRVSRRARKKNTSFSRNSIGKEYEYYGTNKIRIENYLKKKYIYQEHNCTCTNKTVERTRWPTSLRRDEPSKIDRLTSDYLDSERLSLTFESSRIIWIRIKFKIRIKIKKKLPDEPTDRRKRYRKAKPQEMMGRCHDWRWPDGSIIRSYARSSWQGSIENGRGKLEKTWRKRAKKAFGACWVENKIQHQKRLGFCPRTSSRLRCLSLSRFFNFLFEKYFDNREIRLIFILENVFITE